MSKQQEAIRLAHHKGYRVTEEGKVINAVGRERKCQEQRTGNDCRYVFNVVLGDGATYPVHVHRLQAFQKFGEASLEPGIVVRHLDGDATNNRAENIEIGTVRDNVMDRPADERKAHASHAASFRQDLRQDWPEIERDYFEHSMGFKKLAAKYGLSTGTLSNHFNRLPGWKPKVVGPDWDAIKAHLASSGCTYREISAIFGVTVRSCNRKLGPLTR